MKKNTAPADGNFWLYGIHAVKEALENPRREIREFWVTMEGLKSLQLEKSFLPLKPCSTFH